MSVRPSVPEAACALVRHVRAHLQRVVACKSLMADDDDHLHLVIVILQSPNQQQNGRANETESIKPVDSAERASASPAVPAAAGHNNGSNSMTAQAAAGVAAPQLHVLISEDGRALSETQTSYGPAGVDSNNPALAAHASQKHSGPTAILGHDAQSQDMHSNEMPAQMNRGASPAPGNPSLAAPQAVPYSMQGHAGPGGLHPHVIEGRISPRPVSRNQSRGSNYHGQQLYNPDGHHRAPGDTRTQLFVGNVSMQEEHLQRTSKHCND